MQALMGLMWLLVFQAGGELLAQSLGLALPGAVLGMALLVVALRWRAVREPVAACADFLLTHLSLLFVPAGVGVLAHMGLVTQHGLVLLVILLVSTAIGLVVTAVLLNWLTRHEAAPSAVPPGAASLPSSTEQGG
ncbi:CidA/LrgA family protein [Comamonas serinivorans]|uniref:CidA/LrgA family protein n=1 Tax=Comamonas serinivorans TaxID=1082851 RepID=A0A1Y0ET03_9BURK|nr:CidA/LrgA family protein [Comamonas serinivorans]ARU06658.1 CidA/LrgA family protein [Comamonas serinivorans]